MTPLKRFLLLPLVGLSLAFVVGCGDSTKAPSPAPAKALSQEEETLLKELEALPKDKRGEFVMRHMDEISRYSAGNRTFGDRMNAATGATSK